MARKSVETGDMIVMDRGELFKDLGRVQRKLRKALRQTDAEQNKHLICRGVKEIEGDF